MHSIPVVVGAKAGSYLGRSGEQLFATGDLHFPPADHAHQSLARRFADFAGRTELQLSLLGGF